jgi:sortase A
MARTRLMSETGRGRRRALALALSAAVVAAVVTAGLVVSDAGGSERDAPSLSGRRTTTTTSPGGTATTLPLPVPENPPADPHADVPAVAIGTIEIPKIALSHAVYEGVTLTVIDHGPGHWPGSARPGGWGNVVFAGHRVSHSHPFRRINELVAGDAIVVRDPTGTFTYRVTGTEIVTPDRVDIVDQHPGRTITLFACHPPGSAALRYVVRGHLADVGPPSG